MPVDYDKMTDEQKMLLEYDARHMENVMNDEELTKKREAAETSLNNARTNGFITEQQQQSVRTELLKEEAAGHSDVAKAIADEIVQIDKSNASELEAGVRALRNNAKRQEQQEEIINLDNREVAATKAAQEAAETMTAAHATGNQKIIDGVDAIIRKYLDLAAKISSYKGDDVEVFNGLIEQLKKVQGELDRMKGKIEETKDSMDGLNDKVPLSSEKLADMASKAGMVMSSIGFLTETIADMTGVEDENIDKTADAIIKFGDFIGILGMTWTAAKDLIPELGKLATAILGVAKAQAIANAVKAGWAKIGGAWGAGALALIAAGGAYLGSATDSLTADQQNDVSNMMENGDDEQGIATVFADKMKNEQAQKEAEHNQMVDNMKKALQRAASGPDDSYNLNDLQRKYDEINSDNAKAQRALEKEQKKAAAEQAKREKAAREQAARDEQARQIAQKAFQSDMNNLADLGVRAALNHLEGGWQGCVRLMNKIIPDDSSMAKYVRGTESVDVVVARAQAAGTYHPVDRFDNAPAGALLIYGSGEYPDGAHIGLSIGNGQVVHNASSADDTAAITGQNDMGSEFPIGYIYDDSMGTANVGGMSKEQIKAYRLAEQKQEKREKANADISSMLNDVTEKIMSNNGTPDYLVQTEKYTQELTNYAKKLTGDLANGGTDTDNILQKKLQELSEVYSKKIAESRREYENQQMQDESDHIDNLYEMDEISYEKRKALMDDHLEDYKLMLQKELADDSISIEERKKLESQLTEVIKQQHEERKGSLEEALRDEARALAEYEVDYQGSMDAIKDSFTGGLENLYSGIIDGTSSMNENLKNLWKDLTNTIINQIWKIAMEMYVIKPLFNWLGGIMGGGGGSLNFLSGGGFSIGSTKTMQMPVYGLRASGGFGVYGSSGLVPLDEDYGLKTYANGGVANGLSLVGEEGPELVDFQSPARVYTAKQTAQAIGGNNVDNVKVEIINKSGQDVKAESADAKFDGKGYIIQVVLGAVQTNAQGLRTAIKGAATY